VSRQNHPDPTRLAGFLRGELSRAEAKAVVRHLLAGCPTCSEVIRRQPLCPLERPGERAEPRPVEDLPR
jgi:hypothetical protein